jgi:hypothetical protein
MTFGGFLKHHFTYGRGAFHFHSVRAHGDKDPLKIDPGFYLNLFSYPLRHLKGGRAWLLEGMLVLAYIAYTGGFLWQKLAYRAKTGGGEPKLGQSNDSSAPQVSTPS